MKSASATTTAAIAVPVAHSTAAAEPGADRRDEGDEGRPDVDVKVPARASSAVRRSRSFVRFLAM